MPELFSRIKWILCSKRSKKNENVSVARPLGEIGCSPLTLWTAVPRPASPRRAIPWMWRSVRRRWPAENLHYGREILARFGHNMKQFLFILLLLQTKSAHGHSKAKLMDGVWIAMSIRGSAIEPIWNFLYVQPIFIDEKVLGAMSKNFKALSWL